MAKTSQFTDSELISRFRETGNSAYYGLLYKRYSARVFSKCLTMLQDYGKAEDATQDIFTKVFLNLSKFNEKSRFSTWLYSVTYNYCIDIIRRAKKQKNLFSDEMERAPDMVEEVKDETLLSMEVGRLKNVLENLPDSDRMILLMKYQDEFQIKEIAEMIEKSESAVKMKIMRAKEKALRTYVKLYNENPTMI